MHLAEAPTSLAAGLADLFAEQAAAGTIAGLVAGMAVGDEQATFAHGLANVGTGQGFTEDTGWLLGSVTKVLTTTAVMRLVDRGLVDLEAPAQRYVPELRLRDADAAAAITVRMLLNHTNGIDADTLMPSGVRGRDASASYTALLPGIGVLFEPGTCLHYGNAGFVLAGRIIERVTGLAYETAIEREVFRPSGMADSTAVQTQALLRRTAVGAVLDPRTTTLSAPPRFTLPEAAAAAGATPVVTVEDMLAFGRAQLADARGRRRAGLLSQESVATMTAATFDLGLPQAPPVGLGWWVVPVSGTTSLWHGGGSPGGSSSFCVLPEHDAVVVCYASGPRASAATDGVMRIVLEHVTGRAPESPVGIAAGAVDEEVLGSYRSFQSSISVGREGNRLILTSCVEPIDDDHQQTLTDYLGSLETPPAPYTPIGNGLYAPDGADRDALSGFYGRLQLLSRLPAQAGAPAGIHTSLRFTPQVAPPATTP